ncbi:nickel-dependent lactate racemase [Treponema sp.]
MAMRIGIPFEGDYEDLDLPEHTHVVRMIEPDLILDPAAAILRALERPIESEGLSAIAVRKITERKLQDGGKAKAAIIVSDNTRPVPYRGEEGILVPIIHSLLKAGYGTDDILVLIATGMHRAMTEDEIDFMLDPEVKALGIEVVNHDCHDEASLSYLGNTGRGTEIRVNSRYVQADLKIATGLVESHFMAGASGGRKAVCPGLIGEKSTFVFHGAPLMAHENSRDLNLEGNLVHEEALEVASAAGIDFLVNVTLNGSFHITGIFTGHFVKAHEHALAHISRSVKVQAPAADVVVTHGGFVGINHYQTAKCAVGSLGILKKGGYLVVIADISDMANPVGSLNYRTTLALLKLIGSEAFVKLIHSPDWTFIPEQWQVQQWAKVFRRIPQDHLLFYSPTLEEFWYPDLPGLDCRRFLSEPERNTPSPRCFADAVQGALAFIEVETGKSREKLSICWIEDGPYVIPEASL